MSFSPLEKLTWSAPPVNILTRNEGLPDGEKEEKENKGKG